MWYGERVLVYDQGTLAIPVRLDAVLVLVVSKVEESRICRGTAAPGDIMMAEPGGHFNSFVGPGHF
jgi:hypothetical protein